METATTQQIKMSEKIYITPKEYLSKFEGVAQDIIAEMTPSEFTKDEVENALSKEKLKSIIDDKGDLFHARLIEGYDTRSYISRPEGLREYRPLNSKYTGFFVYPKNTYCGWHTNNNNEGDRTYIVYADEDNKSFFRYYDAEKDEIVTKWEKKGININRFSCSEQNTLWHCVGSFCNRISAGFKVTNEIELPS